MRSKILETLAVDNERHIASLGLNTETVAKRIGVSKPTASKWLAIMEVQKIIKHYDIGRSKLWFKV